MLFVVVIIMAFTQTLGIVSVMPFIGLLMEPSLVYENEWLFRAYTLFNFQDAQSFIIAVGITMFVIIVFSNAISALAAWLKMRFAWKNSHRLSLLLLEKYLSMPYSYFLNQNSADLGKNVLGEVKQLTSSYILPMLMLMTKGIMVFFILTMLLLVDIMVSLVAVFVLGGSYALIYYRINIKLKQRGALRMQSNKMRFKTVSEAFGGIKEIKVLHRERYFLKKYAQASKENIRHLSWNAVVGQMPAFALEAITFGGIILFSLVLLIRREDMRQVVPTVALFALAGQRIMPSFQQIFTSFTQMQFNQAVLDRIYADITGAEQTGLPETITIKELPEPLPFEKEIRLKQVTYYYPNTRAPVIANLDLVILRHTSVAFIGSTGAGKTTLADILLGLLAPQEGEISIDGIPLDYEKVCRWQMNLGYVPQHIYLKDDTVAGNIAFGLADKDINRETLKNVAMIANIYDFITKELPHGFDTIVGERGIRLSGGQRQRIGIARALYHDPEVLVFDEATSALDGMTEDAVLEAMENASRLKTLIVIAHRLTTVKNCDVIYMIDKGKIIDSGTYTQLLHSNRQFQSMAKIGK
jgi:ATP-binding cassette subfamily C protein